MAITRIDERAASYGIPHEMVDGNDMLAVYDVAKTMVDRARAGEGASADRRRHDAHAGPRAARRRAVRAEGDARGMDGEGSASQRFRHMLARARCGDRTARSTTSTRMTKRLRSQPRPTSPSTSRCRIPRASRAASTPATTTPCRSVELVRSPFAAGRRAAERWPSSPISKRSVRRCFEEMAADERVFVIGEDVGAYGGAFKVTEGLQESSARRASSTRRSRKRRSSAPRSARLTWACGRSVKSSSSISSRAASTC